MATRLNAKIVIGADTAGARRELDKLKSAFGGLRTLLLGALGIESVRRVGEVVDGYAQMSARLRLVTRDQAEFNAAQKELFALAQRNQAGLSELTTLYTRLAPAIRRLGGGQAETLKVTEAVTLALRISGATAEESASAILQLSQALGAGALRGEEFNAVAEASPRLMQALADALGKPRGELRQMAEQGKLTADVVGNALIGQLGKLRQEASQLPQTIGGAFVRLRNEFTRFAGESQNIGAGARALIALVNALADNLNTLATVAAGVGVALAAIKFGQMAVGLAAFVTSAGGLAATFATIAGVLSGPVGLVALVGALAGAFLLLRNRSDEAGKTSQSAIQAQIAELKKRIAEERSVLGGALPNSRHLAAKSAAEERLAQLEAQLAELENQAEIARLQNRAAALTAPDEGRLKRGKAEPNKKFEEELKRLQEEVDKARELSQLDQTRLDIMRKRFGELTPQQRKALLAAAAEVDAEREFKKAVEDSEEAVKRANVEQQRLNRERAGFIEQVTGRAGARAVEQGVRTLDEEFFAGRISVQEYENGLKRIFGITEQVKEKTIEWKDVIGGAGGNSLFQFMDDLTRGARSLGDSLRGAVAGFADEVRRFLLSSIARQFAKYLTGLVGSFFPSLGATPVYHGGGIAGAPGGARRTNVPPWIFGLAPRFHMGGVVGLRDNEVPAILEAGERVLTADEQRHSAAGGIAINVAVNGAEATAAEQRAAGNDLARLVEGVVQSWALRQQRPGGVLYRGT